MLCQSGTPDCLIQLPSCLSAQFKARRKSRQKMSLEQCSGRNSDLLLTASFYPFICVDIGAIN